MTSGADERPLLLRFDQPASDWEKQGLPIGNGILVAVLLGGLPPAEMQFNVDSLWSGDENPGGSYNLGAQARPNSFGTYQNFGSVILEQGPGATAGVKVESLKGRGVDSNSDQTVAQSTDGDGGSKWCVIHEGKNPVWHADFGEGRELSGYQFTSANDVPERDPASWVLEGSDDGKTWMIRDEQGEVRPIDGRGKAVSYFLGQPSSHR